MLVAPDGELLNSYAKHFLFEADETWADEGPSFEAMSLTIRKREVKVGFGICMDINPYKFEAPFHDFELASFYSKEKVDLVLFSTGWINTLSAFEDMPKLKQETHLYWKMRL